MISDIPSTDDIVQKTHKELLTRIERTGVELTALAGKIRREYESVAHVSPDEKEPFLLLRQGMRELQEALEALGIPDIG